MTCDDVRDMENFDPGGEWTEKKMTRFIAWSQSCDWSSNWGPPIKPLSEEIKEIRMLECPSCNVSWDNLLDSLREGWGENYEVALMLIANCHTCKDHFYSTHS